MCDVLGSTLKLEPSPFRLIKFLMLAIKPTNPHAKSPISLASITSPRVQPSLFSPQFFPRTSGPNCAAFAASAGSCGFSNPPRIRMLFSRNQLIDALPLAAHIGAVGSVGAPSVIQNIIEQLLVPANLA